MEEQYFSIDLKDVRKIACVSSITTTSSCYLDDEVLPSLSGSMMRNFVFQREAVIITFKPCMQHMNCRGGGRIL